ncbi:transposase domain-containing protein [Pseudomonas sp. A006]|nr:transposase domain-containing protein [Pseudomonas paracarnis]
MLFPSHHSQAPLAGRSDTLASFGVALCCDEPVHELARRLNICAQGLASDHFSARSGVIGARIRLVSDPFQ